MLSRLLREKGVLEFIAAAEGLRAEGVAAEFRLVGAMDSRNPTALSQTERERLAASPVDWRGAVDDVRGEIEAADVVVLPSYREGTPRALLEAMAMGRPIITSDAPGCRGVVQPGRTGESVGTRDIAALANAIGRFIRDPTRLTPMGRAARAFVEERYDEAVVIERTLLAYRTAA